jgi:deoxyribodipyrimidine photolyase-related protein
MKAYERFLLEKGKSVIYIECHEIQGTDLIAAMKSKISCSEIFVCDPVDYLALRRLRRFAHKHSVQLHIIDSPNFICSTKDIEKYLADHPKREQTPFYIHNRKKLGLLLDEQGAPFGGKWTYDSENRKKLPKDQKIQSYESPLMNAIKQEAITYTQTHYADHPGACAQLYYATTHQEALAVLDQFLHERLCAYGPYQDAITTRDPFVFHSLLTPALNIGLLSPHEIVERAVVYADEHEVPIQSVEGFLRQIIGWREFMRLVYVADGVAERTANYFNHTRKIPSTFWTGETGIPPVDDAIQKVLTYGYNHHIERLMILGNFMLLCEFDPNEIYHWFMTMYVDSYDWVMVPNVYGMSQYADGGSITTKPYISSSNYIRKMSNDYKKGDWCNIWDGLYWRFIRLHKENFIKNPRMSMMVRMLEHMDSEKKKQHLMYAETFLASCDTN